MTTSTDFNMPTSAKVVLITVNPYPAQMAFCEKRPGKEEIQ